MSEDVQGQLAEESRWVARDCFQELRGIVKRMREAVELGRLSKPEGPPWLAARLREFAAEVLVWADALEKS